MRLRPLASGAFVLALVLIGILGVTWAVSAQYGATPEHNEVYTEEEILADTGNWTAVDHPQYPVRYLDNETITTQDGTTTLQEGTDYEWSTENGSVYWYNSSTVSDGGTYLINYTAVVKVGQAGRVHSVLSVPITIVLPMGVFVVLAMAVGGLALAAKKAAPTLSSGSGRRR